MYECITFVLATIYFCWLIFNLMLVVVFLEGKINKSIEVAFFIISWGLWMAIAFCYLT